MSFFGNGFEHLRLGPALLLQRIRTKLHRGVGKSLANLFRKAIESTKLDLIVESDTAAVRVGLHVPPLSYGAHIVHATIDFVNGQEPVI